MTSCKPVSFSRRTLLHRVSEYFGTIVKLNSVARNGNVAESKGSLMACRHSEDLSVSKSCDLLFFHPETVALILILLTWRICWAPNNASRWQMGFNSAFRGLRRRVCCHFLYLRSKKSPGRLSPDKEANHWSCWQPLEPSVFAKQAMWDRVRGTALCEDACGSARRCSCRRSSASTYGSADVYQAFVLCGHAGSQNFRLLAFDNSWTRRHWPRCIWKEIQVVRTRCMSQKIEPYTLQKDCGGENFDNAGSNIYISA